MKNYNPKIMKTKYGREMVNLGIKIPKQLMDRITEDVTQEQTDKSKKIREIIEKYYRELEAKKNA